MGIDLENVIDSTKQTLVESAYGSLGAISTLGSLAATISSLHFALQIPLGLIALYQEGSTRKDITLTKLGLGVLAFGITFASSLDAAVDLNKFSAYCLEKSNASARKIAAVCSVFFAAGTIFGISARPQIGYVVFGASVISLPYSACKQLSKYLQ